MISGRDVIVHFLSFNAMPSHLIVCEKLMVGTAVAKCGGAMQLVEQAVLNERSESSCERDMDRTTETSWNLKQPVNDVLSHVGF